MSGCEEHAQDEPKPSSTDSPVSTNNPTAIAMPGCRPEERTPSEASQGDPRFLERAIEELMNFGEHLHDLSKAFAPFLLVWTGITLFSVWQILGDVGAVRVLATNIYSSGAAYPAFVFGAWWFAGPALRRREKAYVLASLVLFPPVVVTLGVACTPIEWLWGYLVPVNWLGTPHIFAKGMCLTVYFVLLTLGLHFQQNTIALVGVRNMLPMAKSMLIRSLVLVALPALAYSWMLMLLQGLSCIVACAGLSKRSRKWKLFEFPPI